MLTTAILVSRVYPQSWYGILTISMTGPVRGLAGWTSMGISYLSAIS